MKLRRPLATLNQFCLSATALLCFGVAAYAQTPTAQPAKLPEKKTAAPDAPATIENSRRVRGSQVDPSTALRVNYGFKAWNKSPTQVDSASILMREGSSGRLVQINLVETDPDSSVFSGLYSINWQNIERLKTEFYIPPQDLLETNEGLKKLSAMITGGQLKRNPFILRRTPSGAQTIEVFDTREQAQAALKAYRAEQQIALQNKKIPSDQQVETAKLAADLKEKEAAAAAVAERIRLEQLEAKRIADLLAREAELNAQEKARRKQEAQQLAADALALYQSEKYPEATAKFDKAIELDPDNKGYYFQYGVSLYKTEQFNRSLVLLNLADGPQVNQVEKDYFIALNHFRLKEYDNALASFDKVVAAKNAEISPSAQFYKGVIFFEDKKWDEAKNAFQAVLDTSKDARLDERAEAYVEQILRLQQFELEKSRKWQLAATIGEMYDSNVLLSSDSSLSQGNASNVEGYRSLFSGSARYRPIYEETKEFAVQLDVLTLYTLDKSFQSNQSLRDTDPTVATLTLPWSRKGLLFGKGYKLDVAPGYESIWMSVENSENKQIISSVLLNISNLFIMSDTLYSNFNVEIRRDQSNLSAPTSDDDATAIKVKLTNSNLHFLTDDKSKILTSEIALTQNQAQGRNAIYDRYDLAIGYIQPTFWDTTSTLKLGYFSLNYPSKIGARFDNSYTMTAGASKKISDIYSAGLVTSYNINSSNDEANQYKKWTALLTFSALYAF